MSEKTWPPDWLKIPEKPPWWAEIPKWIGALLFIIPNLFVGYVITNLGKVLSTILGYATMLAFHATVRMAPKQALRLADEISKNYFTPPEEWAAFIGRYLEQMTGAKISLEDITGKGAIPGGKEAMEELGAKFLAPMLGLIMPGTGHFGEEMKITPQDGFDAAERFLGTNLQFQMGAWLLHVLGDFQSFGMFKSLKDLPNAISWSYGIGWLSWLVMGVPFRMGISDTLERGYNATYRPKRPSSAQLAKAYHQGKVSRQEAVTILSEEGWPSEWIKIILGQEKGGESRAEIKTLFREGFMKPEEVTDSLVESGLTPSEAGAFVGIWEAERAKGIVSDIVEIAEDLYRDGKIDLVKFQSYLSAADFKPQEISLELAKVELEKLRMGVEEVKMRGLTPANIGGLFKRGKIDYGQALGRLIRLNWEESEASLFLELYTAEGT